MKRSTRALLIAGIVLLGIGWGFQHFAFQPSGDPGQALVTVFVKDKSARVLLKGDVNPASPYKDSLTVDVTGARGKKEQWLLVVQCPSGSNIPTHEPVMKLYTESGEQQPSASSETVVAWEHTGNWSGKLGCFSAPAANNGNAPAVIQGRPGSFLDATLLSLEADPAAQQNQIITPLYVEKNSSNNRIRDLVEVYQAPNSACSPATPAHMQTPANGTSGDPAGTASPSATNIASRSTNGTSPTPTSTGNPTSTPSPISAVCYRPIGPHTTASEYKLPTSVETTETLENAVLSGYRIDSIFPPEQITQRDKMTWKGIAGLSPSISATNWSVERDNNRKLFIAGILFGIAGGVLVPVAQELLILIDDAAERNNYAEDKPLNHVQASAAE